MNVEEAYKIRSIKTGRISRICVLQPGSLNLENISHVVRKVALGTRNSGTQGSTVL